MRAAFVSASAAASGSAPAGLMRPALVGFAAARLDALWRRFGAPRMMPGARVAPIGLDIAAERLHMVQFDAGAGRPVVRAAVSVPYAGGRDALLADPARLGALVRDAMASRPFRGRQVVSCLAPADMRTMVMSYQRAAGQDDAAAIVRELRERLHAELDSLVVDYLPIRADDLQSAERSAIVVTAPRERVLAYLAALAAARLQPVALDIGPAALARLVGALDAGRHTNTLLLNFGRARSYLSVIWGRRLMLDRDIDFGEDRLAQRLADVLGMGLPEALRLLHTHGLDAQGGSSAARAAAIGHTVAEVLRPAFGVLAEEINKTLIYTASKTRGESVQRVRLLGSVARYPGVAAFVEELVSLPVEVLEPLRAFEARPGAFGADMPSRGVGIGVAAGLALRPRANHG